MIELRAAGFVGISLLALLSRTVECMELENYLEWSSVQFQYDNKAAENRDYKTGKYVPANILIFSSTIYRGTNGTRVFVTTPDLVPGTPYTLSTVSSKNGPGGPVLKAFPSPQAHKIPDDCNSITNVWRAKVDKFGRLWAVDSGKINTLRAVRYVCPPQILIYDLENNNKLIRRYKVPGLSPVSVLSNIELEYLDNKKESVVAYLSDHVASSIVVYDFKNNTSFVVTHPYFAPDPYVYSFFDLNGSKFYRMMGIDGMAVGPTNSSGARKLFFHALAANKEGSVSTDILRDRSRNRYSDFKDSYELLGERDFHASIPIITDNGTMVFANLEDNSILTWSIDSPYKKSNFKTLIKDNDRLQFPGSLQLVEEEGSWTLYITTSKLQKVAAGLPPRNQVNYRILRGRLQLAELTFPLSPTQFLNK